MFILPNVPTTYHDGITFYQIAEATPYYVSPCGAVYSSLKDRCLTLADNGIGYLQVFLKLNNGSKKWRKIHRLVAGRFIPNPENKPDVNHRDGNKESNGVNNLEWVTKSENTRHAYATGLMKAKRGPEHHLYGKSASAETKAKMSAQKMGENHPKFKGWYVTPAGTFASAPAAAQVMGTHAKQIIRWCKSGKKRAEGYDFIPATSEGQALAIAA
ncbi:NUMOD3 domain-containing DNA-binding protein [Hymenobacter psychrophilus]|uniref:NUMOD3 motif-containing protein n=1 Tax=Hymenobacter psychrophilus TaxID=651662 RepID=A0A1H3EQA0_9BACT|nr:NUMOD3 domain-containing DNA-binding protein [Hymenobacter psychrophilus]SDX80785.1 NUMOD3 motif-containing protein [Hymenobacter psychrophilus]